MLSFLVIFYYSAQIESSLEVAAFAKEMQVEAQQFNRTGFSYDTNRQLEKLLYIGDAAMEDQDQLEEVGELSCHDGWIRSII